MKLLHLSFPFQYTESVEKILLRHAIEDYVIYSMVSGRDAEGKHDGSQAFPGNITVLQARISDEGVRDLLADLEAFRGQTKKHRLLQALVLPVDRIL